MRSKSARRKYVEDISYGIRPHCREHGVYLTKDAAGFYCHRNVLRHKYDDEGNLVGVVEYPCPERTNEFGIVER
jgi:hypothetical protein